MPILELREQKIALIREITATGPKKGSGMVDWKQAFILHPEWAEQLGVVDGNLQPVYSIASELRTGRENAGNKSGIPWNTPPIISLMGKIAERYPTAAGKVKWKQAFTEHPDWKDKLGGDAKKNLALINFHYRKHKKRGSFKAANGTHGGELVLAGHRRGHIAHIDVDAVHPLPPPPKRAAVCCPNCGFHMEMANEAYNTTIQMQTQP